MAVLGLARLIPIYMVSYLVAGEYCSTLTDDGSHPFPPISDYQSFQTNMEINLKEEDKTIEVEAYFNGNMQQEMISYFAPTKTGWGVGVQAIFNYKEKQIYVIKGGWDCDTFNITDNDMKFIYTDIPMDGIGYLTSVAGGLKFGRGFSRAYINHTSPVYIRGIHAEQWRSCVYSPEHNSNFTVDYYFSANWTHPVTKGPVLLRIVAKGLRDVGNATKSFETYYDFMSFRPLVLSQKVFQIPDNVYCKGEINTKKIPHLPEQFSYRMEITLISLDFPIKVVEYKDAWYDYSKQLIRLDYRTYEKGVTENNNPITEIHDFNTGVSYSIDKVQDKCTISSISSSSADNTFDPSQVDADNALVITMKDPMQLFYLTLDYNYIGKSVLRGIICHVFIAEFEYKPAGNGSSRFEYYFSSSNWFMNNNVGAKPSKEVPVLLKITNENGFAAEYHFYDFSTNDVMIGVFEVASCYSVNEKKHVSVEFPGPYIGTVEDNLPAFMDLVRQAVAMSSVVSPLRIQNMDVDYFLDTNSIYASFTLLGKAPREAQFSKGVAKQNVNKVDSVHPQVYNVDDCMEYCLEASDIVCNGFDFCDDTCLLFQKHGGTRDLMDSTQCKHYSRIVNGSPVQEQTLIGAWQELRSSVYEGSMKVLLMHSDGQGYSTFIAKSIKDNTVTDKDGFESDDAMSRFERSDKNTKLLPSDAKAFAIKTSLDECAELCILEKTFQCASFSYCHFAADVVDKCLVSSAHPDVDKTVVTDATGCDIYARHYVEDFNRYAGFTGLTIDKTYSSCKTSVKDCALECSKSDKIDCRSFYYCLTNDLEAPTCFISDSRKPGTTDPGYGQSHDCQFFSKKYFDDFIQVGKNRITSLTDGMLFGDISVEGCIERCVEAFGDDRCTDLEYCPNEQPPKCFLPVPGYTYQGKATLTGDCQHYTKRLSTNDSTSTATYDRQTNEKSSSGQFNSAQMASLGIGMVILGAIFGAVVFWAISRARISMKGNAEETANLPHSRLEMSSST
ncbi:uncharacterized protein LOC135486967 [Lineus longissimus]|uniref:uncharacterized protein LOC135486967 n=1 Tax=Lineus longissimus TaxID=88925 RepID=UPI002B4C755F